jgi:mRNA interferase MazF
MKMMKHIVTYNQFDIVKVPFPFTDKNANKKRPALVISSNDYQLNHNHYILAMITSAKNSVWVDDVEITDLEQAGLPAPSKVRFKIFSLESSIIIERLGRLDNTALALIQKNVKRYLSS